MNKQLFLKDSAKSSAKDSNRELLKTSAKGSAKLSSKGSSSKFDLSHSPSLEFTNRLIDGWDEGPTHPTSNTRVFSDENI